MWVTERERQRERDRESASLFPWDFIYTYLPFLGMGKTRGFFKINNQLPKLSEASDGSTP